MSESNRLEREIEEILGKIEHFPEAESRRARIRKRVLRQIGAAISERQRALVRQLARFSISQVMLLSFLLILGSLFFRRASPVMMSWVLYAGIIMFVSSFAIMMFGGRGSSAAQQKWRGRPIRYQSGPTLSQRLRHWWSARTRH
ncbi:MAG: hypothetical protein EXR64_04065 [Dehalococcoidia bacterium]|nr:hypothetical protein [Dehalococcoidia bacterium]